MVGRKSVQTAADIHAYPPTSLLKSLAELLAQIAATNDSLPPSHHSSIKYDSPVWLSLTSASRSALATSSATLTFHARNIPTISLEAYLLRILKYCPTTNDVFLSLLVYFDRMSKLTADATGRTFVIDSYNIHRLVIAGVTVASKFFSDVFYTNSRYAKVGGLPQAELNQLELQFLLLNDFRLVIPSHEMQRYAEQLILFSTSENILVAHPVLHPPSNRRTASTPAAMGAIDAYGGRIPGDPQGAHKPYLNGHSQSGSHSAAPSSSSPHNKTPPARPYVHITNLPTRGVTEDEEAETPVDTEGETETEPETDTGDDSTTDDEPTIRPARNSTSSSHAFSEHEEEEEGPKINGHSTKSGDAETESDQEGEMDVEGTPDVGEKRSGKVRRIRTGGGKGDTTPERRLFVVERNGREKDLDSQMASP